MIGRVNHIAIAVPDLGLAARGYEEALGAAVEPPVDLPEHGVRVAFVRLPNAAVELLEPLGEESPIAGFLARSPKGGMHHVCYEVASLAEARARLEAAGARALGEVRIGAHGRPVLFLHPADFTGVLVELEEVGP